MEGALSQIRLHDDSLATSPVTRTCLGDRILLGAKGNSLGVDLVTAGIELLAGLLMDY
jgi:hypothetical protein